MKKTLYMETTKISSEQTVAQIQQLLGLNGAGAIMTQYDKGEVVSVFFKIKLNDKEIPFRLPCKWEAIYKILRNRLRRTPNNK